MIPFLLHGRRLSAPPAGGPLANISFQPQNAYSLGTYGAQAAASLTLYPDGDFATSGTNNPGQSGLWYSPPTSGAGSAYEIRYTPTRTSSYAGSVVNEAANWVAFTSGKQLRVDATRNTSGLSTATYSVLVEIRRASDGVVVSTGTLQVTVRAEMPATGGGDGGLPTCVATTMLLEPGLVAGDVQLGYRIECPEFDTESIVLLEVRNNTISPQPCWRIVTESGAAVVASDSTPMPLRGGGEAKLPEMLGREVLVADERGLNWERVIECLPVGIRDVVFINVGDNCYFAGEDVSKRIATHNATEVPK